VEITLQRIRDDGEATLGVLYIDNQICFTLEDQHQALKIPGETRIPAGRYYINRRRRGKFYEAYKARWQHDYALEIIGVPQFTDVLIHTGNTDDHTAGCVLVGITADASIEATIGKSRAAYLMVWQSINAAFDRDEKVRINIIDEEGKYA